LVVPAPVAAVLGGCRLYAGQGRGHPDLGILRAGQVQRVCVIIWLTCSGGILAGADGRGEDAQRLGRERVVPVAGVGGRAGFVTL